jgi:RimJ/RimL family protein N-acetyltransferase
VYLIPSETGRGLGVLAISIGCDLVFNKKNVKKIVAKIRCDNKHSISAFSKCGFKSISEKNTAHEHVTLIKIKEIINL